MLETGKKFWMLHMRFHMLDDVTGCLICLSSLVRLMRCGVKPSQSKMGFPKWLLLDSRGVDEPMAYNSTLVILSSLKP
jgi:hypothetical protein